MTHTAAQNIERQTGGTNRAALDDLSNRVAEKAEQLGETGKQVLAGLLNAKEQLAESELGRLVAEGLAILMSVGILGGSEEETVKPKIPEQYAQATLNPNPSPPPQNSTAVSQPREQSIVSHATANRTVKELKEGGDLNDELVKDHAHNLPLLSLSFSHKNMERQVNRFLENYEKNKKRYKKVSDETNLPPILIATLHEMESSMNFNNYLHNGQRLGETTTIIPKGILFKKGEWEKAAIHALGGNQVDENGNKSKPYFQELRVSLGITAQTTDMAKLMAFAEKYNGLGYRSKGETSAYVYGGTSLAPKGKYVRDGEFDEKQRGTRVGVSGLLIAQQAKEKGQPLEFTPSNIA